MSRGYIGPSIRRDAPYPSLSLPAVHSQQPSGGNLVNVFPEPLFGQQVLGYMPHSFRASTYRTHLPHRRVTKERCPQ